MIFSRVSLLRSTAYALIIAGISFPQPRDARAEESVLPDTTLLEAPTPASPTQALPYASPLLPIAMPAKPLYPNRVLGSASGAPLASSTPVAPIAPSDALPLYPTRMSPATSAPALQQTVSGATTPAPELDLLQPAPAADSLPAPILTPPAVTASIAPTETAPEPEKPASIPASSAAVATPHATTEPASQGALIVPPASFAPSYARATPAADPLPQATALPVTATPATASATAPEAPALSDDSRAVLSTLPSAIDATPAESGEFAIKRVEPKVADALTALPPAKEERYDAIGVAMSVQQPTMDVMHELTRAYTALMSGDTDNAIAIYESILAVQPHEEDALFGLAATYHRVGNLDAARPLYARLIEQNPHHREGISNFLVLISEEAPNDALPELERLEQRNPDFSPIPAQTAILLDRLGYPDRAREKMMRAIELSPNNMKYQHNLAIMLDKQGYASDAAALYQRLIQASLRGEAIPADRHQLEKRLSYLMTQLTQQRAAEATAK